MTRGEKANSLVVLAMQSLRRCHPNAGILLVDANDTPVMNAVDLGINGDIDVVHIAPSEDEVASVAGRGTRHHLFYWRHSPEVMSQISVTDQFAVYADGDLIFLRPMDLASLVQPLSAGRIAAAVDESSIAYYDRLRSLAPSLSRVLPAAGAGGPLIQAGLIFTNPVDNGGFYEHFWELAVAAARSGHIAELPFDDMCIISTLLGQGGPQWERFLTLGHEWNYITDAIKDPGVFGCAAHYGGHRAKAFLLEQRNRLFPPASADGGWGSITPPPGSVATSSLVRGPWLRAVGAMPDSALPVSLPFALTWTAPYGARSCVVAAKAQRDTDATLHVYVDGRLIRRVRIDRLEVYTTVPLDQAETVTIVGVGHSGESGIYLYPPFGGRGPARGGAELMDPAGEVIGQ